MLNEVPERMEAPGFADLRYIERGRLRPNPGGGKKLVEDARDRDLTVSGGPLEL